MTEQSQYAKYVAILQKAADLNYAAAVLGWDQEIYMPPKGAEYRGRQLATLASQAHEILTSTELGELLQQLISATGLTDTEQTNVRLSLDDYNKNKKLPPSFVEELSRLQSEGFNSWIEARKENDFGVFAPVLSRLIAIKKKQAELYGYKNHPYDALLDEYEKDATVAMLDPVFRGIRENLPPILNRIKTAQQVNNDCFRLHYPRQDQWNFSLDVLNHMGFDFEAGRQDYSEHPFTTSFSAADVRVTTRVDENNFASMLWSSIHEGGHALYEQGLPENQYGLPLGSPASLGIHESQSRLWENCIGRGRHFWTYFYTRLQQLFPEQLSPISLDTWYHAMNKVEPSLIRTEADEVTYHFHVMIRYEIEKSLIEGALEPGDIPERWNDLYFKYLGIKPKDDKTGVLQDVHWSHGMFGYFPTYSLGSFYAAQFYLQAKKEIPGLEKSIKNGEFTSILSWLREKVHIHGRHYNSEELCQHITGQKLDPAWFVSYIKEKYSGIYGIENWH